VRKVGLLLAAFLVGLGIVVGNRMSAEATGVVVGVVLGVAASVPMALLIMLFVSRRERKVEEPRPPQPNYPPVVIVNPGNGQVQGMRGPYLPPANFTGAGSRAFTVVGEDDPVELGHGSDGGYL
jgi:hypothetical protein